VTQPNPESWEPLRERLAAAVARRDAVFADTASAWARFARAQGWTRGDLETLWDGLTEDIVRRYAREGDPSARRRARREALAAMGALRRRILEELET
jgi:hypothetical protein